MSNQLFRSCMPYVVTLHNGVLCVQNRMHQELFSCKMRKTKSVVVLLKKIAGETYRDDSKNGLEAYLYKTEPRFQTAQYSDYMRRYEELISFFENKYPNPPCELRLKSTE